MATVGNLVAKVSADTAEYSKGLDQASNKTEHFIKGLKSRFGRRSELGELIHIAAGGGAIAAIGMATSHFKELTEKIKEVTEKAHEGGMTTGEIAEGIAKSLPLIGDVYEGLKNITGMLTGIDSQIKEINDDAARQDILTAAMHHSLELHKKLATEVEDVWRKTYQHIELLGKNETGKKLLENAHELINKTVDAKQDVTKSKANDEGLKKEREQLAKLRDERARIVIPEGNSGQSTFGGPSWSQAFGMHDKGADEEVAKALEHRGKVQNAITALDKRIKEQEAEIERAGNQKIRAATTQFNAEQLETAKEGWGKLVEGWDKFKENVKKKIEDQVKTQEKVDASLDDFFGDVEKKFSDNAKKIYDNTKTPLQKYLDLMKELNESGLKGKDFDNAHKKYLDDFHKSEGSVGKISSKEVRFAFNVPAESNKGSHNDPAQKMVELATKSLPVQQTQAQVLKEMFNWFKSGQGQVIQLADIGR